MDLTTNYLGFKLPNPFISSAGPLVDDLDMVRRLEDAGISAIVMHSLFEEQIEQEALRTVNDLDSFADSTAEASSFFPRPHEFILGPDHYLDQIRRIKAAVSVPVIASLNGTTPSGWLKYSRLMQDAGADAIELNIYYMPTDSNETSVAVENRVIESVRLVKQAVRIPVAVKLSPFYSSLLNLAKQLDENGANGLVLFNRVYQPEIDAELLNVVAKLQLSTSAELPLRLRWLGIMSRRVRSSLAVTGGVHTALDAVKAVMAGAHAVQISSVLLLHGPNYVRLMRDNMIQWMNDHFYESIDEMRGCLSLERCPDPAGYERANYARALQSWRV
jgi:dihydroorotate dehydrogenase (fumarate)